MRIADVLIFIEGFAPLSLAEEWDNVGLLAGNPDWRATKALITLDVTDNTVRIAMETGCDLIISHHPMIFKAIKRINDPLLLKLLENRIAVIALHTNLDVSPGGVNTALAETLGLQGTKLLTAEYGGKWQHVSVTVPVEHTEEIAQAAFLAGAGRIGSYTGCSSRNTVVGTFTPLKGSNPYISSGGLGERTTIEETELEFMVDEGFLPRVLEAVRRAHPYETPLLYHFPVEARNPSWGLGVVGRFPETLSLIDITEVVRNKLQCPHPRVWSAGIAPDTRLERIAVCGGAGASILKSAERCADIVITGDIGYHHLLDSRIPIIDAGHFHTEYPVLEYLQRRLSSIDLDCIILPREEHEYSQQMLSD
jgi:dinuclear metal center YbgI/SA1388 family protein